MRYSRLLAWLILAGARRTAGSAPSHFRTLPPGASPPGDARCAAWETADLQER